MLTRKIGSLVRGTATPTQLAMACVLGAMIGFVPSFATSPALLGLLFALLLVLNANLFIATVVVGGAKLLSLMLMPVQFAVGRAVLDGPLGQLMAALINAPVLAWLGLEYYATTGGIVLGALAGVASAAVLVLVLQKLRRLLAGLEAGSQRYKKATGRTWVRGLIWVLFGTQKKTYEQLVAKRIGLPVRPLGIVAALLLVALAWVASLFLAQPVVTAALKAGLERANGATVDVASADLDLSSGQLVVTGLAMADPRELETDLFRAARLEGEVSNADLLRKRVAIDRLVASEASTGERRAIPGVLVGPRRQAPEAPPGEGKTLEDYIEQAERWQERLTQLREWLEKVGQREPGEEDARPGATPQERAQTRRERLAREIAEKGYAYVKAEHLIEQAPTVLVREIVVQGMTAARAPGEVFDATADNVSTQPWLVADAPRVRARSRSGLFEADVVLGGAAAGGGNSTLLLARRGLAADAVSAALLASGEQPVLAGGTVDAVISGAFGPQWISLPLNVVINDSTITLPGAGSALVEQLRLPIGVTGPLNAPRLSIDAEAWSTALARAGATQLANELKGKADARVQDEVDRATDRVRGQLEERLGERLPEGLGGLLPGRKPREEPRKEEPQKEEPKEDPK